MNLKWPRLRPTAVYPAFLALVLCCVSTVAGGVISDGRGIFPVVVQVRDEEGAPIADVSVRLLESGRPDLETISDSTLRRVMSFMEQPVRTDALGSAIVYYYGSWSSAGSPDSYRRELRGRVRVEASDFTPTEIKVAQGKATQINHDQAPVVTVMLKRPKAK